MSDRLWTRPFLLLWAFTFLTFFLRPPGSELT